MRELSGLFKGFPDVFANSMWSWRRQTRPITLWRAMAASVSTPSHVAQAGGGGADSGCGWDGSVSSGDV